MSENKYETAEKIGVINTKLESHEDRLLKIEANNSRIDKLETNDKRQEQQIIENQKATKSIFEGMATKEDFGRLKKDVSDVKKDVSDFKKEIKKEITAIREDSASTKKWARAVFAAIPSSLALGLSIYIYVTSSSETAQQQTIKDYNDFSNKRYELTNQQIQKIDNKLTKIEDYIISKGK